MVKLNKYCSTSKRICQPKPCTHDTECYPSETCKSIVGRRKSTHEYKSCIPNRCNGDKGKPRVIPLYYDSF